MPITPPRRRDAIETSAAIERAAVDLVLEHGYDDVTVDMICARAGVSQRTFFNHFPTKDAALIGVAGPSIEERRARAFIVSTGPLLVEAAQIIRVQPEGLENDPRLLARRIRAIGSSPVLMARQMDRFAGLEHDLTDIILLRLRTQVPGRVATGAGSGRRGHHAHPGRCDAAPRSVVGRAGRERRDAGRRPRRARRHAPARHTQAGLSPPTAGRRGRTGRHQARRSSAPRITKKTVASASSPATISTMPPNAAVGPDCRV